MKRTAFLLVVLIFATTSAHSMGDKEKGDYQPVAGVENWYYTYDISTYKQGTYNLIVRGTDMAGNVHYAGPYDIYIDPASDVPEVSINNPLSGRRVGSRLNIVGTAVDDDGIKLVEVKLDDGEFVPADGKEFWSSYVNMDKLPDGKHAVTARCVDVNDLAGKEKTVMFHLDKKAPDTKVTLPANGALVSGEILIQGTVVDLNGLRSLSVSTDKKKKYGNIGLSYKAEEQAYYFEHRIDTKSFPDGPFVIWFRSVDELGVVGDAAFLVFINNEKPGIEILAPAADEVVNNSFLVTGTVSDRIGIKSLVCDFGGGKTEPIEVIPGNPFWVKRLDFTGTKAGGADVAFIVENRTGNKETKRLRVRFDAEKDKPVAVIIHPRKDATMTGDVLVAGFVKDDDGAQSIAYVLDREAAVTLEAPGAFSFVIPAPPGGKHSLRIVPRDITGVEGKPVEVSFSVTARPPVAKATSFQAEKETFEFHPGAVYLHPDKGRIAIKGEIRFANGVEKAEYFIRQEGEKWKGLPMQKGATDNDRMFEIELRKELPDGRLDLVISATDRSKLVTEYATFFFKGSVTGSAGVFFEDGRVGADGTVTVREGEPFEGFFFESQTDSIKSVELVPAADNVRTDKNGNTISITFVKEGATASQVKVVSTSGKTFTGPNMKFVTDFNGPKIELKKPLPGAWVNVKTECEGTATDGSGIRTVEYALGSMESMSKLTASSTTGGVTFKEKIDLAGTEDGDVLLVVRATDNAGNTSFAFVPVNKDTKLPTVRFIAPRETDELNGLISVSGVVEDAGMTGSIEFTDDNKNFTLAGESNHFSYNINLAKYKEIPKDLGFRITDKSGNLFFVAPKLKVNAVKDKPHIEIQLPANNDVVREDFVVSGMAYDDDGIGAIFYRMDDTPYVKVEGSNNFSIPVAVAALADKPHTVEVKAQDLNGLESDVVKSVFVVSKAEPETLLASPKISEHVKGTLDLTGSSKDDNGIREVYVSFDNGLTYNKAEGKEEWKYRLDSRLLADGTQPVLVKAIDTADTEGLYTTTINIDNSAPVIKLDSPADGDVFTGTLLIDGKAVDNIALTGLGLVVTPIGNLTAAEGAKSSSDVRKQEPLKFELATGGIFTKGLDISRLAPGWYNIKITAADKANNIAHESCDIVIKDALEADRIEVAFPVKGASLAGFFHVSGRVVSRAALANIMLLIDGGGSTSIDVKANGQFSVEVGPDKLTAGDHSIRLEGSLPDGKKIASDEIKIVYARTGPWVSVTNVATGDYVNGRPVIEGKAGYYIDPIGEDDKEGFEAYRRAVEENAVEGVFISFDNGRSFTRTGGGAAWQYRLEAYKLPQGTLRALVRADFRGGISVFSRVILTVDNTPPSVVIINPEDGGRFNEKLVLSGIASDANGIKEIATSLRPGDKGQYSIPEFIQGMYVDAKVLGTTLGEVGLGFTFFQQNVKLQGQIGYIPAYLDPDGTKLRFYGLAIGAKLLANVFKFPFSYFFGPDFEAFSMSFALGANFSYFTMAEGDMFDFSQDGVIVGSVLGQIEFIRFTAEKLKMFNSYTAYLEFSASFISSDIEAGIVPKIGGGIRIGLF